MSAFKKGNCYQFSCGENDYITDIDQTPCIEVDHPSKTITVNRCDSSKELECEYFSDYNIPENEWDDVYCKNISQSIPNCDSSGQIETGQQCCFNKNCKSGSCLNGYCKGKKIGSTCETNDECAPDSYCKDEECLITKLLGEKCSIDAECNSGLGCNLGKCTQIFSLSTGSESEDSKFCQSNFMLSGYCDALTIRLRDVEGILYAPFMCVTGNICDLYTFNGTHYYDYECLCAGYNDLPEGFCGYDLVHVNGIMDKVYTELQYSSSKCSGSKAHSSDPVILLFCESISKEQFMYYWNIYNQHYYYNIFITGALDGCAENYNLWKYTYSNNDYNSFGGLIEYCLAFFVLSF